MNEFENERGEVSENNPITRSGCRRMVADGLVSTRNRVTKLESATKRHVADIKALRESVREINLLLKALDMAYVDKVRRTYLAMDEFMIPMQQRFWAFTEVWTYLRAANVPNHKKVEFIDAWLWCSDSWSNEDWRATAHYSLDNLLGHIMTRYREEVAA
jgi:hypothetical protein